MTPFSFDRHSEKRAPAKVIFLTIGIDEADSGFEPVIGLAGHLILAEQALHPAMQPGENLARILARRQLQHAVEHAPGDERHERPGNAVSGAIADDDGVAVADRLEPEEVAADDVARLPDQEMVVAHRGELAQLRQDRGLDAPRIAQALQDELVGGGGALLALFQLGQIAIDGDAASILGAPLADLNPASIGAVLQAPARRDCGVAPGARRSMPQGGFCAS